MDYSYNLDLNKYKKPGNLLLVPNQRLCRKLIKYYLHSNIALNRDLVYMTTRLNIFSLTDFINNIFNDLFESGNFLNFDFGSGYPLTKLQREIIFKDIIKKSSDECTEYGNSFSANLVARKVIQAWELAQHWELDWSKWSNYLQPEAVLFCDWAKEYTKYLQDNNYIDIEQKIVATIKLLEQEDQVDIIKLLKIQTIDLYGFDEISPLTAKLFNKLNVYSVIINKIEQKNINNINKIHLYVADTIEQEIDNVATWAYSIYQNQNNNSLLNIGIIVPNLASYRELFVRSFEEIIPDRSLWNISGGEYLDQIPVIKVALLLLELISFKRISIDSLNYLLRSQYYLKLDASNIGIDLLFHELKDQGYLGYHELNNQEIIFYLLKINPILAYITEYFFYSKQETLANIIAEFAKLNVKVHIRDLSEICNSTNLPSRWAVLFSQMLAVLGWPAGLTNIINSDENKVCQSFQKTVNSHDYQAIGQWQACCQQLGQLDLVLGSINIQRAITELKNILISTPFQIETDSNKIDVLGMLEGAGLMYDKLWLFNMSSDLWPALPDPNPFIPVDLQRKYLLPHSTAQRELEYAEKLTNRYLHSSRDIIISYSKSQKDTENRLSLLFNESEFENIKLSNQFYELNKLSEIKIIQTIDDPRSIFLDAQNKIHIKSGVKALNLQAICPFRAFAEIRLGAKREKNLDIGPPAWLRGQIIHEILEDFYLQYNNKDKIVIFLKSSDYEIKLNQLILTSLNKFKLKYHNIFKSGIIKIEQEIIYKIIDNFLSLEMGRSDFTVIAVEEKCLIKVNNIQFNVRVDRVDNVNNKIIIIDYKTARQNITQLLNDELFDVQLPIYAFLDKFDNTQAVIFAETMEISSQYNGVGNYAVVEGCLEVNDWDGLKAKWMHNIGILANSFSSGDATLNIEKQICRSCHLSGLCRKDQLCQI